MLRNIGILIRVAISCVILSLYPLREPLDMILDKAMRKRSSILGSSAIAVLCSSEVMVGNVILEKGHLIVVRMIGF